MEAFKRYALLKIGYSADMDAEDPRILEMMPLIEIEVNHAQEKDRKRLINSTAWKY